MSGYSVLSPNMKPVLLEMKWLQNNMFFEDLTFDKNQFEYLLANSYKVVEHTPFDDDEAKEEEIIERPFCQHRFRCRDNAWKGFWKAFLFSYGIKACISLIAALLFRRLYRKPFKLLSEVCGLDTTRFALFLATFNGGFRAIQCLLRKHRQKEDKWNAFAAGCLASFAIFIDSKSRRVSWPLYLGARAIDLVVRYGIEKKVLPSHERGALILFSILSSHIMWGWMMEPETIPRAFHVWISQRGGLDDRQLAAVRDVLNHKPPDLVSWCKKHNIPEYTEKFPTLIPCSVIHPQEPQSCLLHAIKRWLLGFRAGLPIYAPVHLLPLLLFRLKTLAAKPLSTIYHTLVAIFFSTSFITSFQTLYWLVFCYGRNWYGADHRLILFLAGLFSGLSILWEKKSRHDELVLFCLSRNLEVGWRMLEQRGWVSTIPNGEVYAFSLAMGLIMMFYQHEPNIFKPTYLKAISRLFGKN